MQVRQLDDVAAVNAAVGRELAMVGAEGDLARSLLERLGREPDAYGAASFFVAAGTDGRPLALLLQTGRHPMLCVGFVDARSLDWAAVVVQLRQVGAGPSELNGPEPWSSSFAAGWTAVTGCVVVEVKRLRAFDLVQVTAPPRPAAGEARTASTADLPLVRDWARRFAEDIGEPMPPGEDEAIMQRLVGAEEVLLWEVDCEPISMAAINRRTETTANVAWVYTPPKARGRGAASHVVAALSQRQIDRGVERCTLFTDLANPTTNRIYAEVGYVGRCDFVHYALEAAGDSA